MELDVKPWHIAVVLMVFCGGLWLAIRDFDDHPKGELIAVLISGVGLGYLVKDWIEKKKR